MLFRSSVALFVANRRPRPEPARVTATNNETNVRPVETTARPPILASARRRAPRAHRPKPVSLLDDFVAFDDADPIQIGMVVRVMFPVTGASFAGAQEIAADLVIGEDGRARAIRFVQ